MKAALLIGLLLLGGCRAAQVLTTETATTDSIRRQQLTRAITVALSADGRTAQILEQIDYTDQTRRETSHASQAPAPATPWYDRWARWIAGVTTLLVGGGIYLKFFSPLRLL